MWLIKADERVFYVRGDKAEVFVGRSAEVCDLVLAGDTSVSRRHAVLRPEDECLVLQDLRSKYGTYVNENINTKTELKPEDRVKLQPNDRVRFGVMQNTWTVHRLSLVTCTSTLKGENLEQVKNIVEALKGSVLNDFNNSCMYLTMPAITLTVKVLAALAFGRHIVTADFWKALLRAVNGNEPLPEPSFYLPKVIESTINSESVSFAPDKKREGIFRNKNFIFFSRKQMEFYRLILERCGASVSLLSDCKRKRSDLCADNVVVVQFSGTVPGGQETQSQRQVVSDIVNYLNDKSLRVIPDVEIGLAILLISTEKYCNPKSNFRQVLNPSEAQSGKNEESKVLAPETQEAGPSGKRDDADVIIEESLISNEDVNCSTSESGSSRDAGGRSKRKLPDTDETPEHVMKKPTPSITTSAGTSQSKHNEDGNIFNFVEENPMKVSEASSKSLGKKLNFMKLKTRKNENTQEDNIFNFIPDKSDNKNSSNETQRSIFFNSSSGKRKSHDIELPPNKKQHMELPSPQIWDVKSDISQLLKNTFWKSKREEIAKQEVVKTEMEESEDIKPNLGDTVVSIRADLIVKKEEPLFSSGDTSYTGPNFKKFKKVMPLRMQITVIPSSSMSIYRPEGEQQHVQEVVSSDEDDDVKIWTENTKKTKGRKWGIFR